MFNQVLTVRIVLFISIILPNTSHYIANMFFDNSSTCYHAIGGDFDFTALTKLIRNNNKDNLQIERNDTIYLNYGAGTTGTRTIYSILCEQKFKSFHYRNSCNNKQRRHMSISVSFTQLWECINNSSMYFNEECKSINIINNMHESMIHDMKTWRFMSDTPIDSLFPYMYSMTDKNNIHTINTFRDPDAWITRRLQEHEFVFCKKHLWDMESVMHPFDILNCLNHSEYAFESITKLSGSTTKFTKDDNKFALWKVKNAYIKMNTVNMLFNLLKYMSASTIIERSRHRLILTKEELNEFHILPICLWDNNFNVSTTIETQKIKSFIYNGQLV
jgi:hypothetical protein